MTLNVHSDVLYLSTHNARSQACGHFCMGWMTEEGKPIHIHGAIHNQCKLIKSVAAPAAEAELGALFLNCKEANLMITILQEIGHPKPATPIHCENSTAVGIANNTVKIQCSKSMEIQYFWFCDQKKQGKFIIVW